MICIKPAGTTPLHRGFPATLVGKLSAGLVLFAVALAMLAAPAPADAQDRAQARLPTATLTVGMHRIQAELAVSSQQQMVGMMWRTEMGASEGMLFVNEDKGVRCFWMRNTLIPLTIAFLDDDGSIVNTADMQPRTESSHCSARPVRFALEMPLGWFDKRGIKPGTRIRGGPLGQ